MENSVPQDLAERIADWVTKTARMENILVTVYPKGISLVGSWLHLPVSINQGGDAYERASLLQQIEDRWNPEVQGDLQLLLVPARADIPSKADSYTLLNELMQRQHQLLDQIDTADPSIETAQRFQAIRQEWEETLKQMERLHPSLQREVV